MKDKVKRPVAPPARRRSPGAIRIQVSIILSKYSNIYEHQNYSFNNKGKVHKKREKKLIKVSFRYVCVAENFEKCVFFSSFFPTYFE